MQLKVTHNSMSVSGCPLDFVVTADISNVRFIKPDECCTDENTDLRVSDFYSYLSYR